MSHLIMRLQPTPERFPPLYGVCLLRASEQPTTTPIAMTICKVLFTIYHWGGPAAGFSFSLRMRVLKSLRAVRMVRSLRFFRGLRLLVKACQCFLPSLCWAMVPWSFQIDGNPDATTPHRFPACPPVQCPKPVGGICSQVLPKRFAIENLLPPRHRSRTSYFCYC